LTNFWEYVRLAKKKKEPLDKSEEGEMVKIIKALAKFLGGLVLIFLILSPRIFAQERERGKVIPVWESSNFQPRKLIDVPTAGLLPRGSFDFDIRIYPQGGVIFGIDVGLMKRFMIGMSYGGENIIGDGDPDWNPRIEFAAKFRLINESYVLPALAIGFDSQGIGAYNDSLDRYAYKSKGFYAVMSKNYLLAEVPVGFHVGTNYSLENKDKDKDMPLFFGGDIRLNENLGFVAEYDLGTNDDEDKALYGQGYGFLNTGVQWIFSNRLQLEFIFKNMLLNRKDISSWGREFRITYFEMF
jgi:hypothetical protein